MAVPRRLPPPHQRRRLPLPPLSGSKGFAALFTARAVSLIGDGVGNLALVVHVQRERGTGTAVGLLLLVASLPRLLSPLAGAFVDRNDRRAVLIGGELAQGALLGIVLLWMPPLPILLAFLLAKEAVVAVSEPAGHAALPALVPTDRLPRANALMGGLREAGEVLGPLAGGFIVATSSVRAALAVDALTFLLSVPLLLRVPRIPPTRHRDTLKAGAIDGLKYTFGQPAIRALAVGFLLIGFTAADDVALPFLARTLGAGERGIGGLYAAVAGGLLAGYIVLAGGRKAAASTVARGILAGGAVAAAGNAVTGLAPTLAIAVSFQVVRGLGLAVYDTTIQTAVQRSVPDYLLGRVFANLYGAVNLTACLGLLGGGLLLDATSARTVLVACGVVGLVAALVSALATQPRPGSSPSARRRVRSRR